LLPPLFFYNAPSPTAISALSLHDALPIFLGFEQSWAHLVAAVLAAYAAELLFESVSAWSHRRPPRFVGHGLRGAVDFLLSPRRRSEEHTSELQSLRHLVCRLLLEKKKNRY